MTHSIIDNFWKKVDCSASCWLWKGSVDRDGYGRHIRYEGKLWSPHRLSYYLNYNQDPGPLKVCHHCDNPTCVNPTHLFLGTQSDNIQDMIDKGRHKFGRHPGESNPSSKLIEQQVLEIRSLPGPNQKLAEQYNVSKCTIDDIKAGRTWRHLISLGL